MLGYPCCCGMACSGVPPSSSCGVGPQRWAARVVVGCLTSVFACLRHRGVACLGIGLPYLGICLPLSLCGVRPQRSAAFVVVGLHTLALGCPCCCGLPCRGVSLSSSSCGSNVGVGLPDVGTRPLLSWGVGPRRCCGVGRERGSDALAMAGNGEG